MTGTGGEAFMLIGGAVSAALGGALFANRDGYTRRYIEDQQLWTRGQPVSEVRVALTRLMGLLFAVIGAILFVVGLVLTIRGHGRPLLWRSPDQLAARLPPLVLTVISLGQLVRSYRQREEPWTARLWTGSAVLTGGALVFAVASWLRYPALGMAVGAVAGGAFALIIRPVRRAWAAEREAARSDTAERGTAERPHSPEGEQGRSEP